MVEALNFAQCLAKIMEKHKLSQTSLSTLLGSRSDIKHILNEDTTHARRSRFFDKLKESQLFDDDDYQQLTHSLEISRIGVERYRFQQAIDEILSGHSSAPMSELVTDAGTPLKERLEPLMQAEKIDILCFNCCFHSLFAVLAQLFKETNSNISMYHFIQSDSNINTAAEYVSVVMPVLFDPRYNAYYKPDQPECKIPAIGGNLLLFRAVIHHAVHEYVFAMTDEYTVYELPNATDCHMFSFVSKVLKAVAAPPLPVKETSPYKLDFTSLCMIFLSHELNRATYDIGTDLCFQQVPTAIALAAFRDKGLGSEAETSRIISRTLSIHEQRYQNHYHKRKPTYQIMTKEGCERFLQTGVTTDHFVGFRAFTPEERKIIFSAMLDAARANPSFIPLLLIDANFSHQNNLVCYDNLGISIDAKDTDYDISNGYRSVFLMLPEFTRQYLSYYLNFLVADKCYSRGESLAILETIYQRFLEENNLTAN